MARPGRAARLVRTSSSPSARRPAARGSGRLTHDSELGFVTRPGFAGEGVTYDRHGYRLTPAPAGATLAEPPVLAVGDSYAHGDEVNDAETWAALLQPLIGRRTVNAGVSGYGLDQIVLRAEKAVRALKPAALVLVLHRRRSAAQRDEAASGARRSRTSNPRTATLALRNVPVPPSPAPAATLDLWQRLFGWSVLVDTILRHKGWQYEWSIDHVRALPRGAGEAHGLPPAEAAGRPRRADAGGGAVRSLCLEERRLCARAAPPLAASCSTAPRDAGLGTLDLFDAIDRAA